jgi:hypothetical protein
MAVSLAHASPLPLAFMAVSTLALPLCVHSSSHPKLEILRRSPT